MTTRAPLSKRLRFEVFKRDAFKCQYCSASAPDVLLVIDHIKPVASGGTNDLLNLVTACEPCNQGKGAKSLDDASVVTMQRRQREQLQERRQQLETMIEWQEGLGQLEHDTIIKLAGYFQQFTPGYRLSERGLQHIARLLSQHSVAEIMEAMRDASKQYLDRGAMNKDSVWKALRMVGPICRVKKESATNPEIRELYYIRGILKNRFEYVHPDVMDILRRASELGCDLSSLKTLAKTCDTSTRWRNQVLDWCYDAASARRA